MAEMWSPQRASPSTCLVEQSPGLYHLTKGSVHATGHPNKCLKKFKKKKIQKKLKKNKKKTSNLNQSTWRAFNFQRAYWFFFCVGCKSKKIPNEIFTG